MIATVILKNPHTGKKRKKKLENNFRTPDSTVLTQAVG